MILKKALENAERGQKCHNSQREKKNECVSGSIMSISAYNPVWAVYLERSLNNPGPVLQKHYTR